MSPLSLSTLKSQFFCFLVLVFLGVSMEGVYAQALVLKGKTIDVRSSMPVPYVSIGVKNKPLGTVSDSLGRYTISYLPNEILGEDSIIFSAIGYKSVKMSWDSFVAGEKTIKLTEATEMLKAVNIRAGQGQLKTYGRSSAKLIFFPGMYKNIPKKSDEKGREQAAVLKIGQNVVLRKLRFMINRRSFEKIKLRMNIYSVKDGVPDQSILRKDVIFDVAGSDAIGMPRAENIDLLPYEIQLTGRKEIAVSLAIIDLQTNVGDTTKPAFFIPSFPGPLKSSFFRLKGEARWEKVSNSNLMVAIEAMVLGDNGGSAKDDQSEIEDELISKDAKLSGLIYGNNNGKRIKVDAGEIYYETYGKGKPLILMHGNNESINSFREQIKPLAQHFKVIAIDTRGQGNSTNKQTLPYSYDLFSSDLLAVMNALSLRKASLLGWSDGGNTALTFALNHPERLEKMVVMGANLDPGAEAIEEEVIQLFQKRRDSLMKSDDPDSQNKLRLTELVLNEPRLKAEDLRIIATPVMVVAGEFDVIRRQHTLLIHSNIKGSKIEIIAGADHYAPLKNPEAFNKLVLDFLLSPEVR